MQIKSTPTGVIAWCCEQAANLTPEDFKVTPWQEKGQVTGQSRGRYTTWFVKPEQLEKTEHSVKPEQSVNEHDDCEWVLRHYWRGGLAEKLSKDAYLYTGKLNTRAFAELALLEKLYQQGFAVPRPIAANVERFALWYRADIIIERIAGAKDLVAHLSNEPMTDAQWQHLGATIAKFHQHGVYHADLNAKNILLSADKFYLIDFDRGEMRKPYNSWQQANLARLLRSFNKELGKQPQLHFSEDNWQQLIRGYQSA
ncbi:3-deoxy-D-manno-octulosonic acid kinase [Shewanella maritima]|uniref:3-deoxy-D-manno-octulosonic acid kinase n=1 Tax=Shewanella maritima TaxID=2520507 RepID=A0A411PHP9_9GAMM|nr:3-deoxy-D-manno-octulosonic acid kinase [Shewanella maritima]QBF83151.1 3-deoxy-D-manno-octulosonic acid kinase [Shewanella maritima]